MSVWVGAVFVWLVGVTSWNWGWLGVMCKTWDDFKAMKSTKAV